MALVYCVCALEGLTLDTFIALRVGLSSLFLRFESRFISWLQVGSVYVLWRERIRMHSIYVPRMHRVAQLARSDEFCASSHSFQPTILQLSSLNLLLLSFHIHLCLCPQRAVSMICLLLPQALDLGDTVTDVHVVRTVIERQQRLTHFRLCRCIAIENLLLNRILQQILTLEAQSEGINTNSRGLAVFGSTDGCLVMSDGLWCNSEWSWSRWQISSPEEERSCSRRKPDWHGAAASHTEAFFSAAIDCFTSNVSGGGCHWLPTTDFTDRYPWHKQSANALRGTNKSEPCRPSLGKLNGRCLGEIDLSRLFIFLSLGSRQYCPQLSCSSPRSKTQSKSITQAKVMEILEVVDGGSRVILQRKTPKSKRGPSIVWYLSLLHLFALTHVAHIQFYNFNISDLYTFHPTPQGCKACCVECFVPRKFQEVIPCRLDFFGSYSQLPPRLP